MMSIAMMLTFGLALVSCGSDDSDDPEEKVVKRSMGENIF